MNKIMLILVALLFSANFALADCNIPDGVSDVPAWTESSTPVSITIDSDCRIDFYYCYREINGICQIVFGDIVFHDSRNWWEIIFGEAPCYEKFGNMRELMQDYAVSQIAINHTNCVSAVTIPECPSVSPPAVIVFASACETEPRPDWSSHNGDYVIWPCSTSSYCEYEYTWCYKINPDGSRTATYSKEVLMTTTQCAGYYQSGSLYIPCYPQDCHADRIDIRIPSDSDMLTYEDDDYYIANQY